MGSVSSSSSRLKPGVSSAMPPSGSGASVPTEGTNSSFSES